MMVIPEAFGTGSDFAMECEPITDRPNRKYTARELAPLVYDRLHERAARLMGGERADHSLQATALLHESILRLGGFDDPIWDTKWHFLGAAFRAMRRHLVDHARHRSSGKAGGMLRKHPIDGIDPPMPGRDAHVAALLEGVERLADVEPEAALLVNLVHIAGLTIKEGAGELGISLETAKRRLRFAKAWLAREVGDMPPPRSG